MGVPSSVGGQGAGSRPPRVGAARRYVLGLSFLAVAALMGWSYLWGFPVSPVVLGATSVLTAMSVLSRRLPIDFSFGRTTLEIEVADVVILTALVLGGPLCALLVAVPSMLYRDRLRTAYQASAFVLQILAAAYVFGLFSEPVLFDTELGYPFALGTVVAGLALCSTDALTVSILFRIKYRLALDRLLSDVVAPPAPAEVVAVLAALATSYAVVGYGPVAALSLFCGATFALTLLHLARKRRKKLEDLEFEVSTIRERSLELERSLNSANLAFASRLVQNLGQKDGYTATHAAASATYAADLAEECGIEPAKAEKLRIAALLQDVGMAGVPDDVLLTPPKKLNSVGRMHIEQHPIQGERLLSATPGFEDAAKWVRWHHEREDGTGYPDRLRGEWIPLEAKILASASLYASLVLDSPSRPGLSPQEARHELVGLAGSALDQGVARALLRVLDEEDKSYAAAADGRFVLPAGPATQDLKTAGEATFRPGATGETEAG